MLFRASEPLLRFRPRFRWDDDTAAYLITSSTRAICVTRKVETERPVGLEGEHQLKLDWLRDRESEAKRFANSSAVLLL